MDQDLARALALDRRVQARGGLESFAIDGGTVIRHAGLPNVHSLNSAILDAPLPQQFDGRALGALADRWLASAPDRFVRFDDSAAAERLAPALLAGSWERGRTVFMVLRSDPRDALRDPRAREISETEMDALVLANFRHNDYGLGASPDLVDQLVQAQSAMRAGTSALCFGAGEGDGLQSMCTLFTDPDVDGARVAMVETVGTLPAYRERGLAKAAVSAAVAAAGRWGAELVTVPADAEDWPQLLYARLGFEPVGTSVAFTLRRAGGAATCETAG